MLRKIALLVVIVAFFGSASAQEYTGTLKRIAETGEFRIGFVPDAAPMSFLDADGNTVGYSIDLCRHIASAVRNTMGLDKLDISFVPLVAPEDRISAVEDGVVDIECAASTVTLSRRERVDFTLLTFITGAAVLSNSMTPIPGLDNLNSKRIAVIAGTTTEDALRNFVQMNEFDVQFELIETHDDGMEALNKGEVDGYASDRAMLIGQVFRSSDASKYTLTNGVFSFEPYSLMIKRGDTDFRLVADRALASLYRNARIRRIHHNWFGRYGEVLSPIVEAIYEFQAVGE
jgi:ABC-type amino acid transport substrate-binding protein